jgi:hypothetical protein
MPANEDLERMKEQMKALFGAPPLVRGESEEQYWKWWDAFVEEHDPKGFSALIDVNDLAIKQWEQNRLQGSSSALIEGALLEALKNLLRPFDSPSSSIRIINPSGVAQAYYTGDANEKREAREKITKCGITDDQILAEAMQLRSRGLIAFDRMDNHRVSARRSLLKDIGRRKPPDQTLN